MEYIKAANEHGHVHQELKFPDYFQAKKAEAPLTDAGNNSMIRSNHQGDFVSQNSLQWKQKNRFETGNKSKQFIITNSLRHRLLRNWSLMGLIEIKTTPKFGQWLGYRHKSLDINEHKRFFNTDCHPYVEREYF